MRPLKNARVSLRQIKDENSEDLSDYNKPWQCEVKVNNDGTFAVASNVSTKGSGSIKYESIDPKSQSVTYRISFKQLVDAGAKELSLSISNGDATIAYTNEQLEELWDSNYVASIVVDNTLNGTRSVTLRVSFEITINGVDGPLTTETSSTIGLLSYTGVNQ